MKLINENGVPKHLFDAMEYRFNKKNEYRSDIRHDYSASQLSRPGYQYALERQFGDMVTVDAESQILTTYLGEAIHDYWERALTEYGEATGAPVIAEERLFGEIDVQGRMFTISGQMDVYTGGDAPSIIDYKTTSTWTHVFMDRDDPHGRFAEWEFQLNVYNWIAEQNGRSVDSLVVMAIFRDWTYSRARQGGGYPPRPWMVYEIPKWHSALTEQKIRENIIRLEGAVNDGPEGTPCSPAERWDKGDVFAIMKTGKKSSEKNFDSKHEAELALPRYQKRGKPGETFYIQHRPGARTRCEDYCSVGQSGLCPEFNRYKGV